MTYAQIEQEVEDFITEVCAVDMRVRMCCQSEETTAIIKATLTRDFEIIISTRPELLKDIQRRTINFQKLNDPEVRVTDFARIINWFAMEITDRTHEKDYFNPSGEYYRIRMNEVINMYLMARDIEV